jgi:GT2 family glycosyltransferase/spore maturation protein CgeB
MAQTARKRRTPGEPANIVISAAGADSLRGRIAGLPGAGAASVELWVDGQLSCRVPAVAGNEGHSFDIPPPQALFDEREHRISVVLSTAPNVTCSARVRFLAASHGAFRLDGRRLEGEVVVLASGARPGSLRVMCDDQPLQRVSLPAGEVDAQGLRRIPFSATLSPTVCDGSTHRIRVVFEGTLFYLHHESGGAQCTLVETAMGCVDTFDGHHITGWAYDVRDTASPVMVVLMDGDFPVLQVLADQPRDDVNQAMHVTGRHGFSFFVPARLLDGGRHSLSVRCLDVTLRKGADRLIHAGVLGGTGAPAAAPGRYRGRVEALSTSHVAGWAFDAMQPLLPARLLVYVDGELVAETLANLYQARLRELNGSGACAFRCPLPVRLMNGRERLVSVRFAATGEDLPHSPAHLLFPLSDFFGARQQPQPESLPWMPGANPASTGERGHTPLPSGDPGTPVVSIIVLNLDGGELLQRLLASLEAHRPQVPFEVIVVDHGSTDGSEQVVARHARQLPLRWLPRGRNYSFSESNNHAAAAARGQFLLFLNNDIELTQDVVTPMVRHFQDEGVGAVGIRLLEPVVDATGATRFVPHHEAVYFDAGLAADETQSYTYLPVEVASLRSGLGGIHIVPAVTAALAMCRKQDFDAVGGFSQAYVYGLEDVDLCWMIWTRLGKRVVSDTSIESVHYRSYTRDAKAARKAASVPAAAGTRQAANRAALQRRMGRSVRDAMVRSLVDGGMLANRPLRVTFVVTEAEYDTGAGDFYTAMELGQALRDAYSWEVMFASHTQNSMDATDVLVVMRHDFPIHKIRANNPGLVTVAWVRNRADEWLSAGKVDGYDLRFCSSLKSAQFLEGQGAGPCAVMPIATNPQRFRSLGRPRDAATVCFTGSYWGDQRDALSMLEGSGIRVAVYGKGWEQVDRHRDAWRGWVPYWELPGVYDSAAIVLDDSHPVTRQWDSLNSRVFDAIACGAVPVTNCTGGAQELFADLLPTFTTREELVAVIQRLQGDAAAREHIAGALQQEVLARHTYGHRAAQLHDALSAYARGRRLKIAIKSAVPDEAHAQQWGDTHFANSLCRALRRLGYAARVDLLPDWYGGLTASDDIVIVLRGLSAYKPRPDRINLMWVISHPELVTAEECRQYDHTFVASEPFAQGLIKAGVPAVSSLLQCTDASLFYPDAQRNEVHGEVLFVGNSRRQRREAVQAALHARLNLHVYGADWKGLIPPKYVRGGYIPNALLRQYYSSARVVLNDHWPDMRREGFVSNRVFDVLACGGVLVSDAMPALKPLLGNALVTYTKPEELGPLVRKLQADPALRARLSAAAIAAAKHHTFDARAASISGVIQRLLSAAAPVAAP